MSRRIIPVLCALAVAAVPATALAQPAQDPSPAPVNRSGVVYGDTKYDQQNQRDQGSPAGGTAYEQAISGDTKGNLPRAIAPQPAGSPSAPVTDVDRVGSLTPAQLAAAYGTTKPTVTPVSAPASDNDTNNGWQIAALSEAAVLAAFVLAAAFVASRQHRAPRMGV
jgi:hypothetical protein